MSIFDLSINLIEGLLYSIFIAKIFRTQFKNSYKIILIFTFLLCLNISLYNYFSLSEIYYTLSMQVILFLMSEILNPQQNISNLFISMLVDTFSLFSNTLTIMMNQVFFNNSLSYVILVIVSKIIFLLFVLFIPQYLNKFIQNQNIKNRSFHIALLSLLILYTLIFDSLFYEDTINIKLYIMILCIIILTISIYRAIQYINTVHNQQLENQMIIQEFKLNNKNYLQVEHSLKVLSKSQHDNLYILEHIKKLNQTQNTLIDNFIDEQINLLNKKTNPIMTGNTTLDYILYQYSAQIEQYHIHLSYTKDAYQCPLPKNIYYTVLNKMMDIVIDACQDNESSLLSIQHGFMDQQFYIKMTFPLTDHIHQEDIHLIDLQLREYPHILINERDVNVYILGFMLKKELD